MTQITISSVEFHLILNSLIACQGSNTNIITLINTLKRLDPDKGPFILSQGLTHVNPGVFVVNCRCGRQVVGNATCECGMRHEIIKKEDIKP